MTIPRSSIAGTRTTPPDRPMGARSRRRAHRLSEPDDNVFMSYNKIIALQILFAVFTHMRQHAERTEDMHPLDCLSLFLSR